MNDSKDMLLAGDVGGTKIRLALCSGTRESLEWTAIERFESHSVASFPTLVTNFLKQNRATVRAACFGVPGPVIDGLVKVTNLPWTLAEGELQSALGIPALKLVNDLVATAAAIPFFSSDHIETIYSGTPTTGPQTAVVLAPGTGLGQAYVHFDASGSHAFASEGGHSDFAPVDELTAQLFEFLRKKLGNRVSFERTLCGSGIVNIYEFLRESGKAPESPTIAARMGNEDPAAVISQASLKGEDGLCDMTLSLFCRLLGSQAGNLVLTLLATKGVYLGGGIPPKILPKLKEEHFLSGYLDKWPLSHVVERTPVHVILDDRAAVLGAAHIADSLRNTP